MKNVLFVTYYFPPSGGPGVQRVLKHVKYLPDFGWNPIVLTVSNGQFPARDESLLKEIPEGTIVERTKIYEPYDIYRKLTGKKPGTAIDVNTIKKEGQVMSTKEKIAEFIRASFFIPDARIGWIFTARKKAYELIDKYDIKAIYSSSPPYTCSMIAKAAKRRKNLPWVAGFRDPWTGFISSPKRWAIPRAIDISMERSVFTEADEVECAWKGIIKDALSKYPLLRKEKFHHVPNGYDSNDFPKVSGEKNEKFTVTYTGSMYGRRNPEAFFKALDLLIDRGRINKNELHLRFVGRFGTEVEEMFSKADFSDAIETISYVPHKKSIEYLLRSDALLLVVDESKESDEIVPGKVYEYIGVKRPIIAVAPVKSAIAELMKETRSGKTAHQSQVEKIAGIIFEYYEDWKSGTSNFDPDETEVNKYERRESARKLAQLLDINYKKYYR
ncbi:MAG: glycosyltransferase [Bacteroidota bacterium]